jgi:hypothetical protein
MLAKPMPIRFEPELQQLLDEGARRTPHKKQELIRLTLRRYLPKVIEQEADKPAQSRLTNINPLPRRTLEKAYKRMGSEWDALEDAAVRAQGKIDFND